MGESGWLVWGGGKHIKTIYLMLKDCANFMQLMVREKWFWSGKSQ
jgi:hypothetical protein